MNLANLIPGLNAVSDQMIRLCQSRMLTLTSTPLEEQFVIREIKQLDDCTLQLSHNGTYLDLEATLAEQRDELEGFQDDAGRGKKHSIILRTQLSVRVHTCIVKRAGGKTLLLRFLLVMLGEMKAFLGLCPCESPASEMPAMCFLVGLRSYLDRSEV
ncbi:FH1/FH2 domain-containing protein 3 [Myotis davidii]|uniref:FH1/FH2 domain-containing protein 3 n=1 Tax=Myotis davidii TaxID=225400 RepID=L5LPU5_MYODS|nr:FH1/FH2 domain-containing protein 3 [Myotis davidii]